MIIDVEMAIFHYHYLIRHYPTHQELSGIQKEHYENMTRTIVSELRLMVELNECNTYHSVLSMYMRSKRLGDFVSDVFSTESMLPKKVVSIAWASGNCGVIQTCLGLGIDVEAHKNIAGAIRSDNTHLVDMCVGHGASLKLPVLPYRHCRSVEMVNHLSIKHKCVLHKMSKKLLGNHLVSSEYLFLGGHIDEMGELNGILRKQGNEQRSLPIKRAYMRSNRVGTEGIDLDDLGLFLLLPGCIVKSITEYI